MRISDRRRNVSTHFARVFTRAGAWLDHNLEMYRRITNSVPVSQTNRLQIIRARKRISLLLLWMPRRKDNNARRCETTSVASTKPTEQIRNAGQRRSVSHVVTTWPLDTPCNENRNLARTDLSILHHRRNWLRVATAANSDSKKNHQKCRRSHVV